MFHQTNRSPFPSAQSLTRRSFLISSALATAALRSNSTFAQNAVLPKFGLVTYQWGRDWDLPALLANCERAKVLGVELRTTHAHGVEPTLNAAQRAEVKKRFADSPVEHVGIGSNENFDNPDPTALQKSIEATKAFVVLSHDTGGSGVKVKPNSYHDGVAHERTIAQIAESLHTVGEFAKDYGQQIRLEMHGDCAPARTIKQIMDQVQSTNVKICWNSNKVDLEDGGVESNFRLVRDRFGETLHIHELDADTFPNQLLLDLLVQTQYTGWVMLEASSEPADRPTALAQQRALFDTMIENASS